MCMDGQIIRFLYRGHRKSTILKSRIITDRQIDILKDRQKNVQYVYGWIERQLDEQKDAQIDRKINRWIEKQMDRQIDIQVDIQIKR